MSNTQLLTGIFVISIALVAALFGCCWMIAWTFQRTCLSLTALLHRALEGFSAVVCQMEKGQERSDSRLSAITTELLSTRSLMDTGSLQHAAHVLAHSTNDKRMDQPVVPDLPPEPLRGPHNSPDVELGGDDIVASIPGPGGPED
jgi:hypothetical protein